MECLETAAVAQCSNGLNQDLQKGKEQNHQHSAGTAGFSRDVISFSLYGKIPPKCKRPWNESLSARIAEVQESFKNIPPMLYFSPSSVSFDGIGVYAAEQLPKGTLLGPYFGQTVQKDQLDKHSNSEWLWEVYEDTSLAYFVDASDPKYGNWMNFIQCARSNQEQNLKVLQCNSCLYFEALRDIAISEELLVWYDDTQYNVHMGIPVGHKGSMTAERSLHYGHRAHSSFHPEMETSRPENGTFSGSPVTSEHIGHSPAPQGPASSGTCETNYPLLSASHNGSSTNVAMTGSARLSDMSNGSTGTEDSGIGMSMEHENGSQPASVTELPPHMMHESYNSPPPPPLERVYKPLGPIPSPVAVPSPYSSDCFQQQQTPVAKHGYPLMSKAPGSPSYSSDTGSVAVTSSYPDHSSQWSTSGHLQVSNASSGGSKIAEIWPLKSVPKERSSHLLYGMFSKTEDGTRWQCEECKRLFSSQGSLRAHARIHTGERPYQCQYCFRTFCQASTLRSHERLHTGEKPYKCEHCGRAFTQSAGLRSHLKTHRYDS